MLENNWSTPVIEEVTSFLDLLDLATAERFLHWLQPPWCLAAIVPDDAITTRTFSTIDRALEFIRWHNIGCRSNVYYTVNPVRWEMNKKPCKTDIATIKFVHSDLDPRDDEEPEAAKARYLTALHGIPTSAVIDSGNGIQTLTRLAAPIALGEPIETTNKEGKKLLVFSPEDTTKIAEVEACSTAVMLTVGSKGGTHTIDHLLRLPGTVNYPNASKREKGRSIMLSALLELNDSTSALTDFPELDFPPRRRALHLGRR